MSKLLCIFLALSLTTALFTGCGSASNNVQNSSSAAATQSSEETQKPEESTAAPVKEVTLTQWVQSPQFEEALKAVNEAFTQKSPNIIINLEAKTPDQYYALLNTAIQAGDAPDIYWSHGARTQDLPNIVKMGGTLDLTGKVDFSAYGYDKMATNVCFIDGKLYLTPGATIDTRAVYYNKDIFDKNSIQVPNTLADLERVCDTLVSKKITPISFGGNFTWSLLFLLEPIMSGVCPDWIDDAVTGKAKLDDPRLLKAFKKYEEWAVKGYFGKNFMGMDEGAMLLNFSKGNAAMCVTGSWNAETFNKNNPDLKLGAFQMPMENGGKAMVVTYSTGYSAYAKTKYPDECATFLNYIATPDAQQIYVQVLGGVPGLQGLKAKNELMQGIGTADKQVESFYNIISFWPKDGQNPQKIWDEDCLKWIGGKLTAEQFIKEIQDAVDYSKVK